MISLRVGVHHLLGDVHLVQMVDAGITS